MRKLSCFILGAEELIPLVSLPRSRQLNMTTLTVRGDRLGEALQFDPNATTTSVEVGRVWFRATDTVRITFAPASFNAQTGALIGGAGAVIGLTVTTAAGQVTTFGVSSANALDVDPDQSKNGADFFYISESPAVGVGGAYAGLQLEKILVADLPLTAASLVPFTNTGGYLPTTGSVTPPLPQLTGTAGDDVLTGTAVANIMNAWMAMMRSVPLAATTRCSVVLATTSSMVAAVPIASTAMPAMICSGAAAGPTSCSVVLATI